MTCLRSATSVWIYFNLSSLVIFSKLYYLPEFCITTSSVFKNSDNYFAGELIDNAGLKGYSVDNVSVSTKHANFFIAKKGAKAVSLYKLVQYVKEKIRDKYSIDLEEEIKFIGDFN